MRETAGGTAHGTVRGTVHGTVRRTARLRELDLLRFLAAAAVLAYHFTGFAGGGPWPQAAREVFPGVGSVTGFGYLGVDLFFMISGFVILMSVWGRGTGEFAVSRIVRLLPAYWISVLLGAAIFAVFGLGNGRPGVVIPNLTMLQGGLGVRNVDPVYWTLWVEMHFYVLMAVLAAVGVTYRNCVIFMGGWLFIGLYANEADNKLLQVLFLPTWNCYFISGMALFLIYRFGSNLLLWGFVAVGWLMALRWGIWRAGDIFREGTDGPAVVLITGIFAVMILVAVRRLGWLRWRGFTVLGALTYPLYLVHQQLSFPILDAIYPRLNRWVALAVITAASLAVAFAIYRFAERPAQAWLRPRLRAALDRIRTTTEPPRRAAPARAVPAAPAAAAPKSASGQDAGGSAPERTVPAPRGSVGEAV
ncbi:MAG TPA: acyltransferase [Streptosporangiaceae bacterium]|nr:acyltransferase [Streptosporangiaceae bacterium]